MNSAINRRFKQALRTFLDEHATMERNAQVKNFMAEYRIICNEWLHQKIAGLAAKLEAGEEVWRDTSLQQFLPGFHSLAQEIPIADGTIPLGKATITDLREALKIKRRRARERMDPLERLIQEMEPFARENRSLSVSEYYALRLAGAAGERTA